jgi:hypothetical protein
MKIITKLLFYVNLGSSSCDQIEQNEKPKTPKKHSKTTFVWGFCLIFFALVSCNPIEEELIIN